MLAIERDNAAFPDDGEHRKRLAQILRYIASMHQSLSSQAAGTTEDGYSCGFVREVNHRRSYSDFFQREVGLADEDHRYGRVLVATYDFRKLLALELSPDALKPSPFTFYAATESPGNSQSKTRTFTGAIKGAFLSTTAVTEEASSQSNRACWLRMTRLTHAQVSPPPEFQSLTSSVRFYLRDWLAKTEDSSSSVEQFYRNLTLNRLDQAPKLAPSQSGQRQIKRFLRRHRILLVHRAYQKLLEPFYNQLFEWIQEQQNDQELVWGLGHARMLVGNNLLINGPLLEVHMEVELSHDGALLVRPREHTGVTLNRQVLAALSAASSASPTLLAQIHQTISELEPSQLSPGQPNTYIPILKRIAIEISPGGRFQLSSKPVEDISHLVVSEAWCLFARPKPSSVWARDALAFVDTLQKGSILPMATWSLTYGPAQLESVHRAAFCPNDTLHQGLSSVAMDWIKQTIFGAQVQTGDNNPTASKHLFPLPASAAQERIADLLLNEHLPAVVCEGPPGTGKSQSIANVICAYLCQGKRVLVTSKNAPALSVLRQRLPENVQELCVDVSSSEQSGMRQLQQTVERLADRICSVSSTVEIEKCRYLERDISALEKELALIDKQLVQRIEKSRQIVRSRRGQRLTEVSLAILDEAPWIAQQLPKWTVKEVTSLRDRVNSLISEAEDLFQHVKGYDIPVADALISMVASKAGSTVSVFKTSARAVLAVVPVIGQVSGLSNQVTALEEMLSNLHLNDSPPSTQAEWSVVLRVLKFVKAASLFEQEVWKPFERSGDWPPRDFCREPDQLKELHRVLVHATEAKELGWQLQLTDEITGAAEARTLDARRGAVVLRIQALAKELVDSKVVVELSQSFSVEAQSSLIRFAQLAGKTKFSRASQPSKMTQRQRRRRQEYLDAFNQCCRFIPCWILTTSQISDYLPPECLFDLIICDESSQSDAVSILPGMLRGKQWLIVGDTKQVSPTDCFVSEEQVESLRTSLPFSPFSNSLLPGQSFFDLCSQAFPRGRVVLSEHFRCAEEIIAFSNEQFYNGRLIPLRLPKKSERLDPALVDVKLQGTKVGKVNQVEADAIVKKVEEIVTAESAQFNPRSIGIISLIGDEQSRLIRGRLLDTIGPQLMARHCVLVGDPPTFQGAERDIIFLSMVASPGSVPTQSQLMHFQRANVAMSRARDQCFLFRSIGLGEIPSSEDAKILIIEFFQGDRASESADNRNQTNSAWSVQSLLQKTLVERGFTVRGMGKVWKNGLCVEEEDGDNRVGLLIEGAGESQQEWQSSFLQQKAIERVGWKGLRVDALSLLVDFHNTIETILQFLALSGIQEPRILYDELESENERNEAEEMDNGSREGSMREQDNDSGDAAADGAVQHRDLQDTEIVVISSNDEDDNQTGGDGNGGEFAQPDLAPSGPLEDSQNDDIAASSFGQVVDLSFLRGGDCGTFEDSDDDEDPAVPKRNRSAGVDEYLADDSDSSDGGEPSRHPRKRVKIKGRKRLKKYDRDGRWCLKRNSSNDEDDPNGYKQDWYDTDSDVPKAPRKKKDDNDENDDSWQAYPKDGDDSSS